MTESQFSNADPWGLPVEDDVPVDDLLTPTSEPESPAEHSLVDTFDRVVGQDAAPGDSADPEDDQPAPAGQSDDQAAVDGPDPDEPAAEANDPDPDEPAGEVNTATEFFAEEPANPAGPVGLGDSPLIAELDAAVDDPAPELGDDGTDLEALADELAAAIPQPVVESDGPTTDLAELSQKVSAWQGGGTGADDVSDADEEPSDDLGDTPLIAELTDELGDTPLIAELADEPTGMPSGAEPAVTPAGADQGDDPAAPSEFTLSKMLAAAESVFGEEPADSDPMDDLPDELPSWAVEDAPIFSAQQPDVQPASDQNAEPDAVDGLVEQLTAGTELDIEIAQVESGADPFAAEPEPDEEADDLASLADQLAAGIDDAEPGSSETIDSLADELAAGLATDVEPIDTADDPLADVPVERAAALDDADVGGTDLDNLASDLAAAVSGRVDSSPAPAVEPVEDAADEFEPPARPRGGALAAAAAFFRRAEDHPADPTPESDIDEDDVPTDEVAPARDHLSIDDAALVEPIEADADHEPAEAAPLEDAADWPTDVQADSDDADEAVQDLAEDDRAEDESLASWFATPTRPQEAESSDEDWSSSSDDATTAADWTHPSDDDGQSDEIAIDEPVEEPEPIAEDDVEVTATSGSDDKPATTDPWATGEEDDAASGLDAAVGSQPVPSVYQELVELPPAPRLADEPEPAVDEPEPAPAVSVEPAPAAQDSWGSRWAESAQGWVEDADGGSEWRTIVTTADTLSAWEVDTYLGVVNGDATLGAGPLDIALPVARDAALETMVADALTRGAHAVVAVSVTIATVGSSTLVTASGTAATLRTED